MNRSHWPTNPRRGRFAARCVQLLAALSALGALAGCADRREPDLIAHDPAVVSATWSYNGHAGTRLDTAHYEIYTTLDDANLLAALPRLLETCYNYYRTLAPSTREPTTRMRIYIFALRRDWEHFTRRNMGPRAEVLLKIRAGGYMENGVSVVEYIANQTTFPIVAHEGLHQYLHHAGARRVPAWLNEGLAVLCEGQRWDAQGIRALDPALNPLRTNALAEAVARKQLIPLRELLHINAGHVVGESNRKIATYYAQVWALLRFLRDAEKGKYAGGLQELIAVVMNEDPELRASAAHVDSPEQQFSFGRELFRATISRDLDAIEREYHAFIEQLAFAR